MDDSWDAFFVEDEVADADVTEKEDGRVRVRVSPFWKRGLWKGGFARGVGFVNSSRGFGEAERWAWPLVGNGEDPGRCPGLRWIASLRLGRRGLER